MTDFVIACVAVFLITWVLTHYLLMWLTGNMFVQKDEEFTKLYVRHSFDGRRRLLGASCIVSIILVSLLIYLGI